MVGNIDKKYTCVSAYKINKSSEQLKKINKSTLINRNSSEFINLCKESHEYIWVHSGFWEYLKRTKTNNYSKSNLFINKKVSLLPIIATPFFIVDIIDLIDAFDEQFDINVGSKYLKMSEDNNEVSYSVECPNYNFRIESLEGKINQKRFDINWKSDFPNKLTSFRNALAKMVDNIDCENESILIYLDELDVVPQYIYNDKNIKEK